jgi:hypothetical protein
MLYSIIIKNKREEYNKMIGENCSLKFTSNDIKYIFVKNDSDREKIIEFIEEIYLKYGDRRSIYSMISNIYVFDTMFEDL